MFRFGGTPRTCCRLLLPPSFQHRPELLVPPGPGAVMLAAAMLGTGQELPLPHPGTAPGLPSSTTKLARVRIGAPGRETYSTTR